MIIEDWFDRIRKNNEKSELAGWLRITPPDRLGEIKKEGVDLMTIRKNLSLCEEPIRDFEELEKEMLAYQKQSKRDLQYLKLCRIIKGTGMIHILLQCQADDDAINALQEMGLTTDERFVTFPDEIEEFKKKGHFRQSRSSYCSNDMDERK